MRRKRSVRPRPLFPAVTLRRSRRPAYGCGQGHDRGPIMTTLRGAAAFSALLAAAAAGASALAQTAPPERAATVQALADCRKLSEDSARLACYDKAVAALDQAEARGDIVVVDRDQARKVRRQAFGL